jgi:transposase
MRPYSRGLRERILDIVASGKGSLRQIAHRFLVNFSTIVRRLKKHYQTGSAKPKLHVSRRQPALGPDDLDRLCKLIREQSDATLNKLRKRLGVDFSLIAISLAMKKLKITQKQTIFHAAERDTPRVCRKRQAFRKKVAGIEPKHLVFVDETEANTAMTQIHGRAPAMELVQGTVPGNWRTLLLVCRLRLIEVTVPLVFQGSPATVTFEAYVAEEALAPQMRSNDVMI